MQLYANPDRPDHAANNAAFLRVVKRFPTLGLFQPQPDRAPWHWQAVIDLGATPVFLDFWPHAIKGRKDSGSAVQGEREVFELIKQAFIDATEEPFDVIEG